MSIGDPDDDDLEDKIERLASEISQLVDIIRTSMRGERMEENDEESGPVDLWDEGRTSQRVESIEEYRQPRALAASSDNVSAPWLSDDRFDNINQKLGAYVSMYISGLVNLEEMNAKLGDDNFQRFVQLYVMQVTQIGGQRQVEPKLVAIVSPSPQFFGITFDGGNAIINPIKAPFPSIKAYGQTWHGSANPQQELGLAPAQNVNRIRGNASVGEINKRLAQAADRRDELPDRFEGLLG